MAVTRHVRVSLKEPITKSNGEKVYSLEVETVLAETTYQEIIEKAQKTGILILGKVTVPMSNVVAIERF